MATQRDVRRIAMSLEGVVENDTRFAFSFVDAKGKSTGIAWVWQERIDPKKARVPNPKVLAIRVADLMEKEMLLAADPEKLFTEPHYNGYPAILVRLPAVSMRELRELITASWRCATEKKRRATPKRPATQKTRAVVARARRS